MWHREVIVVILVLVITARGRVYYLPTSEGNSHVDGSNILSEEQSSRDLDLSFSAGDNDNTDDSVHPIKKVYALVAPEKTSTEVIREKSKPVTYYKLTGVPVRSGSDDIILLPEKNRKVVKIDNGNKGEVILELRVIANHNTT